MDFLTRPLSLSQRRSAVIGVVQFVILALLIGVAPFVGIPAAIVTLVLRYNVKAAKRRKLRDLEAEYYPFVAKSRLFYSGTRPAMTGLQAGDTWVGDRATYVHDGIDFKEI